MSHYDLLSIKLGLTPAKVKAKYVIPKVAEKRKKVNAKYKKIVKAQAKKDDRCKVKSVVCTGKMQGLHHLQKKTPKNLTDKNNTIPCCNACNLFIEENSTWAKNNGFTISKFKKSA